MNYHLIPNWTERVSETYEFKTTVFTSRSGKEQRMSERAKARRTVAFTTMLWDDRLQAFQALMHERGASTITIPDPARYAAILDQPTAIGATVLYLTAAPPWLVEGMALSLSNLDHTEFRTGDEITNVGAFSTAFDDVDFDVTRRCSLTLTAPLTRAWSAGTVIRPVITGRLKKDVEFAYQMANVANADISLSVLPPSDVPDLGAAAFQVFDGRPVLLTAPNWTQPPSVTHNTPFEEVDYGRGIVQAFLPVEFYTRITQFNYSGRSREDVGELLKLFVDMRGRQGEFYCPSWVDDMRPSGGIVSGTSVLTILGTRIANTYADSTVNNAVAIRLNDGRWIFRKIASIASTTEDGPGAFSTAYGEDFDAEDGSGFFSQLTFSAPIAEDIYQSEIAMICWFNVCRFASDTLSINWMTDDVAQVVAQIMTLESLAAEA